MSVRYAQSSNDDQTASHRPVGDIRDYAAASLFGTAGRFDIVAFWVYIAIVVAVSALSLTILETDLIQERISRGCI
jgi:hypothetical protein